MPRRIKIRDAIKKISSENNSLFFAPSGQSFEIPNTKYNILNTNSFVGPEGGWTSEEIKVAKTTSFNVVSLGKTTLRAETAAIIGTYLAIHSP